MLRKPPYQTLALVFSLFLFSSCQLIESIPLLKDTNTENESPAEEKNDEEWSPPASSTRSIYVPDGYEETFSDNFDNGLSLEDKAEGKEKWMTHFPWSPTCSGYNVRHFPGNQNKQLWLHENYEKDGEKLGVKLHEVTPQGTLKLYGKKTPADKKDVTDGFEYVAGAITTQCSFWQQYGYFEGRMRFDFGKGHHWAFWMLPKDETHTPLELDLVERVGLDGEKGIIYQNSHGEPGDYAISKTHMEGDFRGWVTYGLKWTPTEIVWYVNGQETRRIPNYIHEPMYLITLVEIGGSWPGLPDSSTAWPTTGEIDYIRAYQKQ